MTKKITLSASRDIPLDKLVLAASNVRHIKCGVSIDELAEDIARRTLLQSITVRAVRDADGVETGMFEIPAGGRRFRALELLVRQKRLARNALVPCVVREDGVAEEDSLAENVQRAPLHPLDQFRAFLALREKGQSEEEIAAAFFVAPAVVKQRLKLASVSPKLLDVYAEDGLTLDQLMAFTVNGDHERQEQVFETVSRSYSREPHAIRRMLTEGSIRATDKRVQFVRLDAYVEAGGTVLRDLFQGDEGGWLADVGLVERLVAEKLDAAAGTIRAEGWKWLEVAVEFPYGHSWNLRDIAGEPVPQSEADEAQATELRAEYERLEAEYAEVDELPDAIDARLGEIETALAVLDDRPLAFMPDDVAIAGVFISVGRAGDLQVQRGYVRPEDERPMAVDEPSQNGEDGQHDGRDFTSGTDTANGAQTPRSGSVGPSGAISAGVTPEAEPDEDDGLKPLPDRLVSELTAHRTLALREAVGCDFDVAFLAALHALCLKLFYPFAPDSCLDLDVKSIGFSAQAPGLADSRVAQALDERHQLWKASLPKDPGELWDNLVGFETHLAQMLFAHCVALSVNAVIEPYNRRPRALAHADLIAQMVDLDMAAAGWTATVDGFLGRVTKARIVGAVREARGDRAAYAMTGLKKGEMAEKAATLLAGTNWLPEPLRTPGRDLPPVVEVTDGTNDAMTETVEAIEADTQVPDGDSVDGTDGDAGDDSEAAAIDEPDGAMSIAAE